MLNPDNETNIEHYLARNHKRNGFCFPEFDHKMGVIGFAKLNVSESSGDSTELIITKSSKGAFKKEANENAREIKYNYTQTKNELVFDEIFFVTPGVKFRDPEVDIRLHLPIGKVVCFDNSLKYMLNDVENTTNTWDGYMVGRRWIMTEKGLKCIDCDNLESDEDSEEDKEDKVVINEDGIKVRNKETQIDINAEGIKIKTPEENVNIKNDNQEKDKKEDQKK
ncbi:MAG: hypothetical protein IT236_12855 [Bacteroidia bacterium]|nr:hypothetical protein [Bacteroidia bacterium]